MSPVFKLPSEDHWRDDQTCSYCGSMHPDLFMSLVESGQAKVEPTDKDYKAYVHRDGVGRMEKFYYAHMTRDQKIKFIDLYNKRIVKMESPYYVFPFFMAPA